MKPKIMILLCCSLIFIVFLGVGNYVDSNTILGLKMVDEIEYKNIKKNRVNKNLDCKLLFNGDKLPLVDNKYYFISQSMDTDNWQGFITSDSNYEIKVLNKNYKKSFMQSNEAIRILVYNHSFYCEKDIIISGLPIMYLKNHKLKDHIYTGNMLLIDNGMYERKNIMNNLMIKCRYHTRGSSSYYADKKSYKLNLLNNKGTSSKNKSLLGMRDDNDWILNPMYLDNSYLREKISLDIWNLISDRYQHKMEYIELVIDGEYKGLYCLQEPVDYKTFSTTKVEGFMYSIKTWQLTNSNLHLFSNDAINEVYRNDGIIDEFEIEKYKDINLQTSINLLRTMKADLKTNDLKYSSQYKLKYDVDNSAKYSVFINMIMAIDNTYKNEKIMLLNQTNSFYKVLKTPWDLDVSMMNENTKQWNLKIDAILKDEVYSGNLDDIKNRSRKNYFNARNKFFNMKYLNNTLDYYYKLLIQSGAIARNSSQDNEFESNVNYLRDYFEQRISILDDYYGDLQ